MQKAQYKWVAYLLVFVLFFQSSLAFGATTKVQEDPNTYQWDMTEIFANEAAFNQACQQTAAQIKVLDQYLGKLGQKNELLAYDNQVGKVQILLEDILIYGMLYNALDVQDEKGIIYSNQANQLITDFYKAVDAGRAELLNLPKESKKRYEADPQLEGFSSLFVKQPHELSPEAEAVFNEIAPYTDFSSTYNIITMSELELGTVVDRRGRLVQVTPEMYQDLVQSDEVNDRVQAQELYYGSFAARINSLADLYQKHVALGATEVRLRAYDSSLARALEGYEVTMPVYQQIKKSVNENLNLPNEMEKTIEKMSNVSETDPKMIGDLQSYAEKSYTMEEAKTEILASLTPLGPEYVAIAKKAFEENWIDAYPGNNKMTGAWSVDAGNHPYILVNFTGTFEDVCDLAHELGHALHFYYTNEVQPPGYQGSALLASETASQTSELLYRKYKLGQAKNDGEKLYVLNSLAEQFQGAVYTQTRYVEFEESAHAYVEAGGTLTAKYLNKLWYDGLKKYGVVDSQNKSQYLEVGWATVPHFYSDFYVFNYALSYLAADLISDGIASGEMGAAYIEFLKAGNSQAPLDLLNEMGIDLSKPEVYDKAFDDYQAIFLQMNTVLNKHIRLAS